MKKAVVAVTRRGAQLAGKLNSALSCDIYVLEKYCTESTFMPFNTSVKDLAGRLFSEYREIVLIMACGIAVRSIAPWLRSKQTDPAVVVTDEAGRFAISLVSGHIGGANRLANEIAGITGGCAVITTASDIQGIDAVDTLAQKLNLVLEDFEAAKAVTAVMVNGGTVGLVCDEGIEAPLIKHILPCDRKALGTRITDGLIHVGYTRELEGLPQDMPAVSLIVRNLVIGVGCRKGVDSRLLLEFVKAVFQAHNLSLGAVKTVATVDVKEKEKAITDLSIHLKADMKIIGRQAIAEIEKDFQGSDFVRQTIGVGSVCEPAACIASGGGEKLVPKTAHEGMTLSVYMEKVKLEDLYER